MKLVAIRNTRTKGEHLFLCSIQSNSLIKKLTLNQAYYNQCEINDIEVGDLVYRNALLRSNFGYWEFETLSDNATISDLYEEIASRNTIFPAGYNIHATLESNDYRIKDFIDIAWANLREEDIPLPDIHQYIGSDKCTKSTSSHHDPLLLLEKTKIYVFHCERTKENLVLRSNLNPSKILYYTRQKQNIKGFWLRNHKVKLIHKEIGNVTDYRRLRIDYEDIRYNPQIFWRLKNVCC